MNKKEWKGLLGGVFLSTMMTCAYAHGIPQIPGAPMIHGHPTADTPHLLIWPRNAKPAAADLTDPTADLLYDLHGNIEGRACRGIDLVVSTEGNYHMALETLWHTVLLPRYGRTIRSWYYSTSPPIALPQLAHNDLSFGNLYLHCRPSVAIAAPPLINKLKARGFTEGQAIPIFKGRGNVLLVKYGNPLHIRSVWDLGRPDVHLVTPNPYNERGAFLNYAGSIYEIAKHDPHPPKGWTANRLFNAIFNSHIKDKWLFGARIHHRDEPWSVAYGKADVAMIMYQLGKYTKASFPHEFTLIPLGGTLADPRPLPGNKIGSGYLIRIKGHFTARQRAARRDFIKTMESPAFTRILRKDGLTRP
ncbi:MAG TPA: substrate-binding domain-containing protein [Acidiferrobacter sp.]|nr:substrate-binding domain-containing protein [Acidiferrobacter sp.]